MNPAGGANTNGLLHIAVKCPAQGARFGAFVFEHFSNRAILMFGMGPIGQLFTAQTVQPEGRTPGSAAIWSGFTPPLTTGLITFDSALSAGSVIAAGFGFDVPVRFDTDTLDVTLDLERLGSITSTPLPVIRR